MDLQNYLHLFLYSLCLHPPHVLGIYLYINFIPGEYFNGLFDFRKSTFKLGSTWANTQTVSFEGQWQQLSHQGTMGCEKTATTELEKQIFTKHVVLWMYCNTAIVNVRAETKSGILSLREFSVSCLSFSGIRSWPAGAVGSGAFFFLSSSSLSHCFFLSSRLSVLCV